MTPAGFAQTNLGAVGFHREITLLDRATVEMPKIRRQSFQQEFPFDLTRDFAVAGLKVAGHNTIFSGPSGAGKPQRHTKQNPIASWRDTLRRVANFRPAKRVPPTCNWILFGV